MYLKWAQKWGLVALMAAWLPVCAAVADAEDSYVTRQFNPVGATSGLDARVAVSMIFDRDGFLWIGSREGLFRFDGHETRAFLPTPGEAGGISDVDIRVVFAGDDGMLWIGTNTGGLNRLDTADGTFTTYRNQSDDPTTLPDDSIYGIAEGPAGGLWVATQRGLGRLDRETGRFERFRHEPGNSASLSHDWAFALHRGPTGTLWVGTVGGGLNRWEPATRSFTRFDVAALTGGSQAHNDVFTIHEREADELWLGTREGLVVLNPRAPSARDFPTFLQDGYEPLVTSMAVDPSGRYWVGTMIHGVIVIDPESKSWQRANEQPLGAPGQLPARAQMSVAVNRNHVFVGTWGDGVYRAPLNPPPFRLHEGENNGGILRNQNITAVLGRAEAGAPWVGSFGGGPQLVDLRTGVIRSAAEDLGRIGNSGVLDLAFDANGRRFAATNFGLFEFDETGRAVFLDAYEPDRPHGLGPGYVSALLPTADGDLWVGVMGAGLYLRDGETGRFTPFTQDPDDGASISGDFITALAAGVGDTLWVGTRSNGLNHCVTRPWRCARYSGRDPGPGTLSHFHVTALYRDRRGHLWVGTDGGGLNRVRIEPDGSTTIERWTREDGLIDDGIMSIEEDVDESLWLGTRHGLTRFNAATGQVVSYVAESGLPASHFNTNASGADEDFLYFGSVDGLLSFPKGSLLEERTPAPVKITQVQTAARGQLPAAAAVRDNSLVVPYGEVVTIKFATLDYTEGSGEYAYRVAQDESWTSLGTQRQVIFHGLAPGEYRFQARGRDSYGLWGESEPLLLRIEPPFWMTTGFRALLAALLVLGAWGLHVLRLSRQRRSAAAVQRLSTKREEALEQALGSEAELAVLTPRQKEVLQLVAEGYSTREIASLLDLSIKTVEAHRANLMDRLDIRDVPGLVRLAIRARLVSPHD